MNTELQIVRFIPTDPMNLFNYFIKPELLELWVRPISATVKIPLFEGKVGGKYRIIFRGVSGEYLFFGQIKEFEPRYKVN